MLGPVLLKWYNAIASHSANDSRAFKSKLHGHWKPSSQWQHSFHLKAELPLAERLVTAWHLCDKTGPWCLPFCIWIFGSDTRSCTISMGITSADIIPMTLVQDCSISIANTMEILQSGTKSSTQQGRHVGFGQLSYKVTFFHEHTIIDWHGCMKNLNAIFLSINYISHWCSDLQNSYGILITL